MSRTPPYDAHLSAQDPQAFEKGFEASQQWMNGGHLSTGYADHIYRLIRDSTGVPFPETAAKAGLIDGAYTEGFMLGVYGHVALER